MRIWPSAGKPPVLFSSQTAASAFILKVKFLPALVPGAENLILSYFAVDYYKPSNEEGEGESVGARLFMKWEFWKLTML